MKNIRTVNLVWEQRIRGTYPVARYALDDEGTLALAVPRPLEARTYDLTRISRAGSAEVRSSFASETLMKLDITAQADDALGMTADDVYLFHVGGKGRFLGERRLSFVEAMLSADGRRVAVAFSDMAGASFAIAYGEISGREIWTRDEDVTLTALALSRDGTFLALGAENGTLWLTDSGRRNVWEFGQGESVRALACSQDGSFVAYGTADGKIGLIGADGARRWLTEIGGEITAVALSADGAVCAALHRTDTPKLTLLTREGRVGWEIASEKPLVGLALSPSGEYLAASVRDGTVTLYEVVPGEAQIGVTGATSDPRAQAESLTQSGDLEGACRLLRAALDTDPANVALCEELIRQRDAWLETCFEEARTQAAAGEYAEAFTILDKVLTVEPDNVDAMTWRKSFRDERGRHHLGAARRYEQAGDTAAAETALLEAIADAPFLLEARRELAALRARHAAEADTEADRLLAQGDLEAGVAALERAQSHAPTPERAQQLLRAQTAQEFAAGMAHYNEKRYREAIFQFQKVLSRDPEHAEARRYLGYAQKFAQDTHSDTVGDRFSRLE